MENSNNGGESGGSSKMPGWLNAFIYVPAIIIFFGTCWFWQPFGQPIEGVQVFAPLLFLDKLGPTFGNFLGGLLLAMAWVIPAGLIAFLITKLFYSPSK